MNTKIMMLIKSGKYDTNIITFLVLESYFRPLKHRALEYIYWCITGNQNISLGLSQIKVKNNSLIDNKSLISRIKNIIHLEGYGYNYICINLYINANCKQYKDDSDLCKCYNGEYVSMSYIKYFSYAKKQIEIIKGTLNKTSVLT
ncbi:MAG: hypothetical protein JJE03_00355 [Peptostreptococcaceae bacterium]|nr:hypothetical protein [Peptostreptococcaceae bacterium]